MNQHRKKLAPAALLLAAFTWGTAFLVIKDTVDLFPPMWLLAYRFLTAGVLLTILCIPRLEKLTMRTAVHGMLMGIILFFEFWFFTVGIQYTTGSKSSFIIASYIIILPLIDWIISRRKPLKNEVLASAVCIGGLAFILLGSFDGINRGDAITMMSALFYALHISFTGIFAKKDDAVLLNLVQILTGGVVSVVSALLFEQGRPQELPFSGYSGVIYLAVFCTIIPYLLSVWGQKYVKTSTSGILLSFESVFGCLCSVAAYGEKITVRFVFGAVLVVGAFFLCSREPGQKRAAGKEEQKQGTYGFPEENADIKRTLSGK